MRGTKQKGIQLNCFSPSVMLATLLFEVGAALYVIFRYKMTTVSRLLVALLAALAVFQLCEYFVCTAYGLTAVTWSRLGYVAISTLPALGLHLMHVLAGKPRRKLVAAAYATMLLCIVYFLTYSSAFAGYQCTGNYVIFQIGVVPSIIYGLYYYGWLMASIGLGLRWSEALRRRSKGKMQAANKLRMVQALILGYLVFMVPTALVYSVSPSSRQGIPSIMCGFAVLLAFILVLSIAPLGGVKRRQ